MILGKLLIMMVLKFGSFFCSALWAFLFNVFGFITKLIHGLNTEKDANFFPNSEDFEETGEVAKRESSETEDSGLKKNELVLSETGDSVFKKNELVSSETGHSVLRKNELVSYETGDSVFKKNELVLSEGDSVLKKNELVLSESKYQFLLSADFRGFVFNPEGISFTVEEMFVDSNNDVFLTNNKNLDDQFEEDVSEIDVQEKVHEALDEKIGEVYGSDEADEDSKEILDEIDDFKTDDFDEDMDVKENDEETEETISQECEILENHEDTETFEISLQQIQVFCEDQDSIFRRKLDLDSSVFEDDYIEINPCNLPQDGYDDKDCKIEFLDGMQKFEEDNSGKNSWGLDSGDEDEVDILKQHQDLVQQMKMEMRYAKVKGLPTISEDCESPKSVEDMKPLRIDEKFEFKDCMAEIQKFYKSYAERMKKLDILNYQKLHAISFLQLKDSEVFMAGHKSSNSVSKPFIPKFWPCKMQRIYADSTHKLLSETYQDLELVYIGQICHSWEILNWQYAKAKELLENDSQGYHSYNKVASEFQQFQVLMERFVEDEPFHGNGGRIQHYVKNRCVLRSLLHVPVIKDDCSQDKKAVGGEQENMISVTELAKIIKQSMEVFWEFLSCEKGESKMNQKAAQVSEVDIHDPEDAKLLMDTKLTLQQKERRLKDILRSRNCIVKKFQKCKKNDQNHALFTSQVELRLVSRVLSLSRITKEQSMWCQRKLDNISFLGRKVHVEPSFWLFPC